jgi:hypothetical protein
MRIAFAASAVSVAGVPAALPGKEAEAFEAVLWMGGLILGVLVVVVLLAYLRRRFRMPVSDGRGDFTLEDLRQMRKRGGLTDEEYEALKKKVLERA